MFSDADVAALYDLLNPWNPNRGSGAGKHRAAPLLHLGSGAARPGHGLPPSPATSPVVVLVVVRAEQFVGQGGEVVQRGLLRPVGAGA